MTPADLHALLRDARPDAVGDLHDATDPWVEIHAGGLHDVARFLRDDPRCRFDHLNDLHGTDVAPRPGEEQKFTGEARVEVVYHLSSYEHRHALVLKVLLPRWKDGVPGELPEVAGVADLWPIAEWHERECYDLVGVRFTGHPDLTRILTTDDWVGHPLRKDYEMPTEYRGIRCR